VSAILFHHQARDASDDRRVEIGGKARGLAKAERAGFDVPAWFVLTADAFTESLGPVRAAALEQAAGTSVERIVESVEMCESLREQLAVALAQLCPAGERVAVRSSASDEDGAQHSFAGQLESVLDVAPTASEVAERIREVWRSGFSARMLAYRREHGLPPLPRPPAVIVQRMVQARAAGVAFGADPISGRRAIAVISAVRGIGASLVSGEADADTWRVDRRGQIVERRIITSTPVLRDDEVLAIARLARDAGRRFGAPQDIEWAFEDQRQQLLLLQARPITSLATLADPDGILTIWDNSNIVESYSGVTTPLTFSFASEIYAHVYRQFCRLMRVPARAIDAHDDVFRNMLGLIRGRLYYNLPNWYRVLALLPGYRVNRPFMEQMMGVREPLPPEVIAQIDRESAASSPGRITDAINLIATVVGLIASYATLNRRVKAFTRLLDTALADPDPPLEDRRPDELAAHYRDLRQQLLLKWDAPLVNDFFAMIFYGLLRKLVQRWCGDPHGTLQNDLIGGTGGMVSAEPAIRLRRLAQIAASDGTFADLLRTGTQREIERALESAPTFRAEYRAYLAKFGERTVNELKLESPTFHDDPLPLLRAIGNLARQGDKETTSTHGDSLRVEARRRVAEALRWRPVRSLVFRWVLRQARERVRGRENLRLERTRLFGRVRRVMRELGSRFRELGLLDDAGDVFYLEVDEILALVEGRSTCTDVRGLAGIRRREFEGYLAASPSALVPVPDDRFETRGLVYQGNAFRYASAPSTASPSAGAAAGDERAGLGCCPGVVRGAVRVVRDPRGVTLAPGTILVAEHTDPGWILIFPSAAGLLVERGSLLSHAAIVARELGIPAVVSLPGLTRWLSDGDVVELDGATGSVRKLPPDSGGAHAE
jgi:phosphohistidine swiveling domain-containing protein